MWDILQNYFRIYYYLLFLLINKGFQKCMKNGVFYLSYRYYFIDLFGILYWLFKMGYSKCYVWYFPQNNICFVFLFINKGFQYVRKTSTLQSILQIVFNVVVGVFLYIVLEIYLLRGNEKWVRYSEMTLFGGFLYWSFKIIVARILTDNISIHQ